MQSNFYNNKWQELFNFVIMQTNSTKTCSKCNQTLPIDNFHLRDKSKGYRRGACVKCFNKQRKAYREANKEKRNAYNKAYRESNKEKLAKRDKAYRESNKEKIAKRDKAYYEANKEKLAKKKKAYYEANKDKFLERSQAYYEANKEKRNAYNKAYRESNKEKIAKRDKAYYEANKPKIIKKWNAYKKQRAKKDPLFRIKNNYSGSCRRAFKSIGQKKNNSSLKLLGLNNWKELEEHLSKQFHDHPETGEKMTFDNHGFYGWHIDHITPLSSAKTEEDIIKLCHYTNLQPLWAEDNLSKGNKIDN